MFGGDPGGEHPDDELRGCEPMLALIACGPEDHCWRALERWTAKHPLRLWETAEVLVRDLSSVRIQRGQRSAVPARDWEVKRMGTRVIQATYRSVCGLCGDAIFAEEEIANVDDEWCHRACVEDECPGLDWDE